MRPFVPGMKSFLLLALVLASGCTLNTDYFSEYRGKNLLANHGFGAWSLVTDTTTATVAASHFYTYAATDYMTWAAVGTGTDAPYDGSAGTVMVGPDGVSPAYRLEIKNLLTDGDFEGLALGTGSSGAFWTPSGGAATLIVANASQSIPRPAPSLPFNLTLLNSQFLYWTGGATAQSLTLNVKTAATAGLWLEGGYQFRYDLVNLTSAANLTIQLDTANKSSLVFNGGDWDESQINSVSLPTLYPRSRNLTLDTLAQAGTTTLTFGSVSNIETVALDNVRLVKSDIDASVGLTFPSLSTGALKLLPGTKAGAYTFSFYVRDDPTALASPGLTHRPNRLEPSGITVAINAAQKTANTLSPVFTPRPASGWSGWTKVTVDLGIDFVDNDGQLAGKPALVIRLTPTNTADNSTLGRDAGSLLVAQPVLTYNP